MEEETARCHTCHLQSCPQASKGHTESMPFTTHYCKGEKHDELSSYSFVFSLQTLKPEAVSTLGKLRLCLNHSKVRATILPLSNASTAAAAADDDDSNDGDDDDNFYNILAYYISQKIK